jgi:hypothetical protein
LAQEQGRDVAVTETSFSSTSSGNNNNGINHNISLLSNITTPQKLAPPPPSPPPQLLVVPPPVNKQQQQLSSATKQQLLVHGGAGGDSSEMGANPKLPHGLTVQELKEMTKARLQAEAAEFVPSSVVTVVTTMNHLPPQQQQHPSSQFQHQQQQLNTMPPPPPPHMIQQQHPHHPLSQPSTVSLRSTGSMTVSSQPSHLSLNNTLTSIPPPGFLRNMNSNSNASDNWENISVSTAASGSRLSDIDTSIPFCRSASYPNQYQYGNGGPAPMRQRAATLSPRPYAPAASARHPHGSDLSGPPPPTSSSSTSDNNRARTSSLPIDLVPGLHITWGAFSDTANATMSFFSCDAGIVNNDDLASILKLSGAEEDDDDEIDDTMDYDNVVNHHDVNEFRRAE